MAALFANAGIAILKFAAYLLTDSRSMLSETYHSISDTGNQVLLLVGLAFAGREATRRHPFGWGKAEYFYAFVVAVLLFGIAGWESVREGLEGLAAHHVAEPSHALLFGVEVPGLWISFAVLAGAFAFESYALAKAYRAMRDIQARSGYDTLWETFRGTKDAAVLTAFTEDILALAGLVVAGVGLGLTAWTGNPVFDAAGAILIGLLLMGFALLLAWEQKRLIVGEAMETWQEDEIRSALLKTDAIETVLDLRTVHFGTDNIVVTADVRILDDLDTDEVEEAIDDAEARIREAFPSVERIYIEPETRTRA